MAIGIQTGVSPYQDFDDLFEPRQAGDPTVSTTGVQASNETDISQLYVPLSFGGSAISNNTGVQNSGGTDCRNLFAAAGTVSRVQAPWNGTNNTVSAIESGSSTAQAVMTFTLASDGTFSFSDTGSSVNTISNFPDPSGDWLLAGSASDYEAQISLVFDINTGGSVINEMSSFVNLGTSRDLQINCANNLGVTRRAGTATVTLRRASNNNVLSVSTFDFDVTADGTS